MGMKKSYKRLAIFSAMALSLGVVGQAQAGTYTNTGTAGTTISTEIFGSGSATTLLPTTATASAKYVMAAAPGAGAAFNIEYTLNNGATFGTAVVAGDCAYTASATGAVTISVVSGGTTTDSTVKFRVDVTAAMAATDFFELSYHLANVDGLATSGATQKIDIAITDGLGAVDTSESLTAFTADDATTDTLTASSTSTDLYIDVTTNSTKFAGTVANDIVSDQEVILGSLAIVDSGSLEDDASTPWVSGAGDAGNTTVITLTADFSASLGVDADSDTTTADGVYWDLNDNGTYDAGEEADSLSATAASWTITNQGAVAARNFHMKVDGTTAIGVGAASVNVTQTWTGTNYNPTTATGTFRNLQKNGSTDTANFALTPGGSFSNYVRISNTSSITGDVYLKLYQDDGTASSVFKLSDVSSAYSDSITAYGSTDQMTIQQLFDASGLAAGYTGKLRIEAEGEFSSIDIQTYTVSLDGQNFSTF